MDNFYYAQFAEDLMLSKMFDKDYKGFFVDIGALDGIWLSNTYMMEQKGYSCGFPADPRYGWDLTNLQHQKMLADHNNLPPHPQE